MNIVQPDLFDDITKADIDPSPVCPFCWDSGKQANGAICMSCPAGKKRAAPTEPAPINYNTRTIDERFEDFHSKHPEVFDMLVTLAYQAKAAGRTHIGMKMLFEVLRWERTITGLPDETQTFKLSNDFTSRYARKIMLEKRDLLGLFTVRELRSA